MTEFSAFFTAKDIFFEPRRNFFPFQAKLSKIVTPRSEFRKVIHLSLSVKICISKLNKNVFCPFYSMDMGLEMDTKILMYTS
jgi:hypothetical protein